MTYPDRNVKVYIQTNKRSFVEMNAVDFAKTLSQIENRIDLFSIELLLCNDITYNMNLSHVHENTKYVETFL